MAEPLVIINYIVNLYASWPWLEMSASYAILDGDELDVTYSGLPMGQDPHSARVMGKHTRRFCARGFLLFAQDHMQYSTMLL